MFLRCRCKTRRLCAPWCWRWRRPSSNTADETTPPWRITRSWCTRHDTRTVWMWCITLQPQRLQRKGKHMEFWLEAPQMLTLVGLEKVDLSNDFSGLADLPGFIKGVFFLFFFFLPDMPFMPQVYLSDLWVCTLEAAWLHVCEMFAFVVEQLKWFQPPW